MDTFVDILFTAFLFVCVAVGITIPTLRNKVYYYNKDHHNHD